MPARLATRLFVYINGEYDPTAEVMACELWTGGQRSNSATIMLDFARRGQLLVDQQLGGNTDQECLITGSFDGEFKVVHWGMIDLEEPAIGDDGETIILVSRIPHDLYGQPIFGQRQYNQFGGEFVDVAKPIVFNPEVDGRIRFNRRPPAYSAHSTFVDDGAALTESAWSVQSLPDGPQPWTLATIVEYLCWQCNKAQTYIQNPVLSDLQAVMGEVADEPVRNVQLPQGRQLPELLDLILDPYGMTWCVDYIGEGTRKIRVIRFGHGEPLYIGMQRPGDVASGIPQVKRVDVAYSQASRINEVEAHGSRKVVEATFELVPAWSEGDDETDPFDLSKDDPEWINRTAVHRVWRDWVLNEAGDYNSLRGADVPNLSVLLIAGDGEIIDADGWSVPPMRLEFLPTLTLGQDGKPAGRNDGVFVEYFEPETEAWLPFLHEEFPDHVVRVLRNECGIRFDGAVPPFELYEIKQKGYTPRVRVTASIELPIAVRSVALNPSPRRTRRLTLALDGQYHHRYLYLSGAASGRIQSSEFATRVFSGFLATIATAPNGQYITSTRDDSDVMAAMITGLRDAWDQADVSGTLTLEGLELMKDVALGKKVDGIIGRNISLYANDNYSKAPQVLGIVIAPQMQQVTVTLNSAREIDDLLGNALADKKNRSLRRGT